MKEKPSNGQVGKTVVLGSSGNVLIRPDGLVAEAWGIGPKAAKREKRESASSLLRKTVRLIEI